eukprot:3055601-Amphidinium_carterae.1
MQQPTAVITDTLRPMKTDRCTQTLHPRMDLVISKETMKAASVNSSSFTARTQSTHLGAHHELAAMKATRKPTAAMSAKSSVKNDSR